MPWPRGSTSARMNTLSGFLGKAGWMPPCGAALAVQRSHMTLKGVHFPDLGMAEAVWVIDWSGSLVVGIDALGNNFSGPCGNMHTVPLGRGRDRSARNA